MGSVGPVYIGVSSGLLVFACAMLFVMERKRNLLERLLSSNSRAIDLMTLSVRSSHFLNSHPPSLASCLLCAPCAPCALLQRVPPLRQPPFPSTPSITFPSWICRKMAGFKNPN
jgi:hypothetical protein